MPRRAAKAQPTDEKPNSPQANGSRKRPADEERPSSSPAQTPKRARRGPVSYKEEEEEEEKGDASEPNAPPAAKKGKQATPAATRGPRKSKGDKAAAAAMPPATRALAAAHRVGAHVSAAGGVQNAVGHAAAIGANAFALFLKSQRRWESPALKAEHAAGFAAECAAHGYAAGAHALPHGSYLVNLASADAGKAAQAYGAFVDDLQRCERLGIGLYNFHPGNTNGEARGGAIARLAGQLNRAHGATGGVVTVLENMAAAATANTLGGRFEDLRDTIALVEDKARVGVCLDTCHLFAAGYDLRTPAAFAATMDEFERVVGLRYLRAWHLNDSKGVLGSHRDLHQNIGLGFLGLRAFHNLMNDARFEGMPMILETPIDRKDEANGKTVEDKGIWAREIKLLESLVGMDADGEAFEEMEKKLAADGAQEREKLQSQYDKKQQGEKSKTPTKGRGGKKAGKATADSDGSGGE